MTDTNEPQRTTSFLVDAKTLWLSSQQWNQRPMDCQCTFRLGVAKSMEELVNLDRPADDQHAHHFCRNCETAGHWTQECPLNRCHNCGQYGHIADRCSQRSKERTLPRPRFGFRRREQVPLGDGSWRHGTNDGGSNVTSNHQ